MYWNTFCGPFLGWWPFHGPFIVMVLGLIVVVFLNRLFVFKKETGILVAQDSAMDTIRQRYSTGEISEEEYLQKKDNLK